MLDGIHCYVFVKRCFFFFVVGRNVIERCLDGLCDLSMVTSVHMGHLPHGWESKEPKKKKNKGIQKAVLAFRFDSICLEMGHSDIVQSKTFVFKNGNYSYTTCMHQPSKK